VKVCPECQNQFGDEHEFCPRHGKRLTAQTIYSNPAPAGPGATTVFFSGQNQHQPKQNYERLIGTVLDGRYQLLEIRGEGGMGVVFRARHTVIEKTVAVKILKREVASDRQVLQRFVQEAKAASRIGHWAIVDVTDFGTLPDGSAYQVMEFISGDTLAKVMKLGPMWSARAVPIAAQIARALAAAHEKGIVHRDLKPENIFLTEKDSRPDMVKIVDFGIAKFAPMGAMDIQTRITRAGAVFGTPEYMSPEQAAGRSDTDHRVDIYALGILLYEMVVGRVPHKGDTIVATLAQQMLDPVMPPRTMNPKADCTDRLEQVIITLLAKDRDKRYQTMFDVWRALEWVAEELGIVLDAPGGPPPMTVGVAAASTPAGISVSGRRVSDRLRGGPTLDVRATDRMAGRGRRGLWAIMAVLSAAAIGVGLGLAVHNSSVAGIDAGHVTELHADAGGRLVVVAPDATSVAMVPQADAGAAVVAVAAPDAGGPLALIGPGDRRPTDVRIPGRIPPGTHLPGGDRPDETPPLPREQPEIEGHGPDTDVVVSTRPHGASLYMHGLTVGSDGTTFRRPKGTRMEVRCLFPGNDGWEPGLVSLSFDGGLRQYTCEMEAKTRCVKDIKNPFKNCPL
jgi:eukaryotic-like serine/threonine-protein kinase